MEDKMNFGRMRESTPVILSIIRDSGWCYAYGFVSVIATVPVLMFETYEIWKCRKEGWHKIMHHVISLTGVLGTSCLMLSDFYFGNHLRPYAKWIFGISPILLCLFFFFSYCQFKKEKKVDMQRVMTISKETRGIVFIHGRLSHLRKPVRYHHMMTRSRVRQ
jgi:hypothetical protein